MSLALTIPRKWLPLLGVALCVLLCLPFNAANSPYFPPQSFGSDPSSNQFYRGGRGDGGPVGSQYPTEHNYAFDHEVSTSAKADRGRMSTYEFLERHGLPQIADQLGQFIRIFDTSTHFLDHLEIDILNAIIATFRDSFVQAVEDARRSMGTSSGPISLSAMREFLHRQEVLFNSSLQNEPFFRKWASLLSQTHIVFDSLGQLYQLCIDSGVPLSWWMLQMLSPIVTNVPNDLLDEETFSELLKLPVTLQSQLHELLEEVFTSGYGPVIKIAIQTLANLAAPRHDDL